MNLGPQYGDAQKIAQVASGLKRTNGTSGPLVQRNPAGRPATGQAPQQQIPQEHLNLAQQLAQAEVVRQQWAALAAQSPTPHVTAMANIAQQNYDTIAQQFYAATPNLES